MGKARVDGMFEHSDLPIRADIVETCEAAWRRVAAPGAWFDGAQRLAIAAETRNATRCGLCAERKAALSPFSVIGDHASLGALPDTVVEVIHRVRTDSGRLAEAWYRGILAQGLDDAAYVEIVGVVATTTALDTLARALGMPESPLPPPGPDAPSRHRPAGARRSVAWVPTLEPEDVTPEDPDPYPGKAPGEVYNIHRALSLAPEDNAGFFDLTAVLYLKGRELGDFSREPRAITHAQMELLAARVSAINQCRY